MSDSLAIPMEDFLSAAALPCVRGAVGVLEAVRQQRGNMRHERLHDALSVGDCTQAHRLLNSGMQLCSNCFPVIVRFCEPWFLNAALQKMPDGVNSRGENGATLAMMCDSAEKMQVLLKFNADLTVVNDQGDTVLLHFVKHWLDLAAQQLVDLCIHKDAPGQRREIQIVVNNCISLLQCILKSGVDINARDSEGHNALHLVLQKFEPGFVFHKFHGTNGHDGTTCTIQNDLAAQVVSLFLHAGSAIPPADEDGTTALMLACRSPWNWNAYNINLLLQRGEDVNAVDNQGRNSVYNLLYSFKEHCSGLGCELFVHQKSRAVDHMLSFLLESGAQLQGLDILMEGGGVQWTVLVYLLALKDSYLNKLDFPGKSELKNGQETVSFLTVFLEQRGLLENPLAKLDWDDVVALEEEIEQGLEVRQRLRAEPSDGFPDYADRLSIPDALQTLVNRKIAVVDCTRDPRVPLDRRTQEELACYFEAVDVTLVLLLPFWPYPPLALLLLVKDYGTDVDRCVQLAHLLHGIGGPLTPGSELHRATRRRLLEAMAFTPGLDMLLQTFDIFHGRTPSLLHMARNVLRTTLKEVDSKGLDSSVLKVFCQGKFRDLPGPIQGYLNFKKMPE